MERTLFYGGKKTPLVPENMVAGQMAGTPRLVIQRAGILSCKC
jgi:hypothetical protein